MTTKIVELHKKMKKNMLSNLIFLKLNLFEIFKKSNLNCKKKIT